LQLDTVAHSDFGRRLRYRSCDIGEDQCNQETVEGTRRRLPAASVLENLKGALAQSLSTRRIGVHEKMSGLRYQLAVSGGTRAPGKCSP